MEKKDYIWDMRWQMYRKRKNFGGWNEKTDPDSRYVFRKIIRHWWIWRSDRQYLIMKQLSFYLRKHRKRKSTSDSSGIRYRHDPIGFRHPKESIRRSADQQTSGITIEGAFTHFARADEQDLTFAHQQFAKYQEFLMLLEEAGIQIPVRHCNNSAGILWHREGDLDAVRPGITLYGIAPSNEVVNPGVELHPMMELKSHISFVKEVEAGVAVSYGGTFVTTKDSTRIATIPVGYADGYPRSLSNKGYVLINGKKAPIIGRVCMDQFMVDVSDIPEAVREAK